MFKSSLFKILMITLIGLFVILPSVEAMEDELLEPIGGLVQTPLKNTRHSGSVITSVEAFDRWWRETGIDNDAYYEHILKGIQGGKGFIYVAGRRSSVTYRLQLDGIALEDNYLDIEIKEITGSDARQAQLFGRNPLIMFFTNPRKVKLINGDSNVREARFYFNMGGEIQTSLWNNPHYRSVNQTRPESPKPVSPDRERIERIQNEPERLPGRSTSPQPEPSAPKNESEDYGPGIQVEAIKDFAWYDNDSTDEGSGIFEERTLFLDWFVSMDLGNREEARKFLDDRDVDFQKEILIWLMGADRGHYYKYEMTSSSIVDGTLRVVFEEKETAFNVFHFFNYVRVWWDKRTPVYIFRTNVQNVQIRNERGRVLLKQVNLFKDNANGDPFTSFRLGQGGN